MRKWLEPKGALASFGALGIRHAPGYLISAAGEVLDLANARKRADARSRSREDRSKTHEVAAAALASVWSVPRADIDWPAPDRLPPAVRYRGQRRRYLHRVAVPYGDAPQQVLDVWRSDEIADKPAPVLVFVPGGAWVHGRSTGQGYALMALLAGQGWLCLSIDYRVSPRHRWPRQLQDVKAAVAWARANVSQFGGDPSFVAVAGCSAGGHLAALAGLTPDDAGLQMELPSDADTSVDAVVDLYGRYDWEDRSTPQDALFVGFLENVVVGKRYDRHPDIYRAASPLARIRSDAPPFLVVHGTADRFSPVAQARTFVERLQMTSRSPVCYLELPGAGHAFDITDGARTGATIASIGFFLNETHRRALHDRLATNA